MTQKARRPTFETEAVAPTPNVVPRWCFVALGIVIIFFSLIRVRLLKLPLERDEGEYAYAGQLMLQGIPPYRLAYNMKLPGTYAAYSVIMAVFGESPTGIHLGLLLINAATVILMFLLANRLFGPLAGLAAGSSYALFSTSESVLGFAGHATHFVVLAALGGILVLLKAIESQAIEKRRLVLYFISGLLLGLSFVCKQPGIFFILFGGFFLMVSEWPGAKNWALARHLAVFSAGAAIPFALTCVILFFAGVLGKMWFWTFSYGAQYASALSLSQGWHQLSAMAPSVAEPALFVWILAGLGLVALAWDSRSSRHALFAIGFLLFSWAAVCPGFYFRQHYFIVLLPAVSLFVGIAVGAAERELAKHIHRVAGAAIPLLVFLAAMVASVAAQSAVFFGLDPVAVCRHTYGNNPFPEAQTISEYINRQTAEGARIAVIGSEPEIYFYSMRHSATGYIYTYPLVEPQKYASDMQKDMAREIENSRPEYMVFVQVPDSWLPSPDSSRFIFDWFRKYTAGHYDLIGIADETVPKTAYIWGDAAKSYRVQSDASLSIFKRRND